MGSIHFSIKPVYESNIDSVIVGSIEYACRAARARNGTGGR